MLVFPSVARFGLLATLFMLASQPILAELIIAPESGGTKSSGARSQREKAGSYQKDSPVNSEESEYGLMSPRGGSPAEDKAYENRIKARSYQQGGEYAPAPLPAVVPGVDGGQSRATEQRNRARAYTGSGNGQDIDLSHVGRDGIPLVTCRDVDNVSGRIGDDTTSGSLVYIVRQGQQVKVRCR